MTEIANSATYSTLPVKIMLFSLLQIIFQILMSVCWKLIHVIMMQIALIPMVATLVCAMWASLEMETNAVRVYRQCTVVLCLYLSARRAHEAVS